MYTLELAKFSASVFSALFPTMFYFRKISHGIFQCHPNRRKGPRRVPMQETWAYRDRCRSQVAWLQRGDGSVAVAAEWTVAVGLWRW